MTTHRFRRELAFSPTSGQRLRLARRSLRGKLKGKSSEGSWNAFVNQFYDGGDKLVVNPNPKGRSEKVRFDTAYKSKGNKSFRDKINKDYEKYLDSLDNNEPKKQKAKPLSDLSNDVQDAMGKLSPAKRKRILERALHEEESGAKSRTEYSDMPKDVKDSMNELSSAQRQKVLQRALQKTAQPYASGKRLLREARDLLPEGSHSRHRTAGWEGALGSYKTEPRFDVEIVPGEGIRFDLEEVPPVLWADTRRQAITWLNGVARRALRAVKTLQRARR